MSDGVDGILVELPGAEARKNPDGSVSFEGRLSPTQDAEARAAAALEAAGPAAVRCSGNGNAVICTTVTEGDVIPAIKAGETIYHRAVYRSITNEVTSSGSAVLIEGELVCNDGAKPLRCVSVKHTRPTIPVGQTIFVTYRPFNITFTADGMAVNTLPNPQIPIARGK